MKDIVHLGGVEYTKTFEWSIESFNSRTGNKCTSFRPNLHTNETPDVRDERQK